jgi:hypothetical protein
LTNASKFSVFALDFFHYLFRLGCGGAAMNPGQILPPGYGISSSQRRHQSSCSWMGKTSSSKYTGSSLAFVWGFTRIPG